MSKNANVVLRCHLSEAFSKLFVSPCNMAGNSFVIRECCQMLCIVFLDKICFSSSN